LALFKRPQQLRAAMGAGGLRTDQGESGKMPDVPLRELFFFAR
jgi:hypothetical protein